MKAKTGPSPSVNPQPVLAQVGPAIRAALLGAVLLGVVYPFVLVVVCGTLFAHAATGSVVTHNGRTVGSALVSQPWHGDGWFHGRPSAAAHDPMRQAGSNLAPSNPALRERVAQDSAAIASREQVAPREIPPELLAASGAGLDPHVSPAAAEFQVARVARERGLSEADLRARVAAATEPAWLGVFGEPRVNVLLLNLSLDVP